VAGSFEFGSGEGTSLPTPKRLNGGEVPVPKTLFVEDEVPGGMTRVYARKAHDV
jgi:hypothetical protein